jgi:hypothetical protein
VIVLAIGATVAGLVVYHPLGVFSNSTSDFKISTTSPQNGPAGSTEKTTLSATAVNGFNSQLTYSLRAPSGLSCQTPSSSFIFTLASALELDCSSNTSGIFILTITVTSGSASHQTSVSFTFASPTTTTVKGRAEVIADTATEIHFTHGTTSTVAPINPVGNYSISLSNFESYNVTLWNGTRGRCSVGAFTLRQNSTEALTENYSCMHPQYPTVTNVVCNSQYLIVNITYITCQATVDPSSSYSVPASGQVTWSTYDSRFIVYPASCTLYVMNPPSSSCPMNVQIASNLLPSQYGPTHIFLLANYTGHATHLWSGSIQTIFVSPPPASVAVSGTAKTSTPLVTHATELDFKNTVTGDVVKVPVTSGNYDVTLANVQSYQVTLFYASSLRLLGSCDAGTLSLQTEASAMAANWQC